MTKRAKRCREIVIAATGRSEFPRVRNVRALFAIVPIIRRNRSWPGETVAWFRSPFGLVDRPAFGRAAITVFWVVRSRRRFPFLLPTCWYTGRWNGRTLFSYRLLTVPLLLFFVINNASNVHVLSCSPFSGYRFFQKVNITRL